MRFNLKWHENYSTGRRIRSPYAAQQNAGIGQASRPPVSDWLAPRITLRFIQATGFCLHAFAGALGASLPVTMSRRLGDVSVHISWNRTRLLLRSWVKKAATSVVQADVERQLADSACCGFSVGASPQGELACSAKRGPPGGLARSRHKPLPVPQGIRSNKARLKAPQRQTAEAAPPTCRPPAPSPACRSGII